jgi:hypothetical protein
MATERKRVSRINWLNDSVNHRKINRKRMTYNMLGIGIVILIMILRLL